MNWSQAADIATAVSLAGAAVGLAMAAYQLRASQRTSRGEFLHNLEVDAQRFQPLFHLLLAPRATSTSSDADGKLLILSALNFFEKIQLLLEIGSVDLKSVDRLFAGRFFLLMHSPEVQTAILFDEPYDRYLSSLSQLYKSWYLYRKERQLPIHLEENCVGRFL